LLSERLVEYPYDQPERQEPAIVGAQNQTSTAPRVTSKTVTAGTAYGAAVVHEHTTADRTKERYRGWLVAPGASLQQAKFNPIARH
jgi:hypothetical protein